MRERFSPSFLSVSKDQLITTDRIEFFPLIQNEIEIKKIIATRLVFIGALGHKGIYNLK